MVDTGDLMFEHTKEEEQQTKILAKTIKARSDAIATLTKKSKSNKKQMTDSNIKFNALKDDMASTPTDTLSEKIK